VLIKWEKLKSQIADRQVEHYAVFLSRDSLIAGHAVHIFNHICKKGTKDLFLQLSKTTSNHLLSVHVQALKRVGLEGKVYLTSIQESISLDGLKKKCFKVLSFDV